MFADLSRKWKSENCSYTPASPGELAAFERQRQIKFPADLRRYFLEINGTSVDGDSEMFEFYPLDKFKSWRERKWALSPNTPSDFDPDRYYIFADYMISCWAYAICLDNVESAGGEVIACGWREFAVVADSFTEFMTLYLLDDRRIYPPVSNA